MGTHTITHQICFYLKNDPLRPFNLSSIDGDSKNFAVNFFKISNHSKCEQRPNFLTYDRPCSCSRQRQNFSRKATMRQRERDKQWQRGRLLQQSPIVLKLIENKERERERKRAEQIFNRKVWQLCFSTMASPLLKFFLFCFICNQS